ncbi:MAG: exodeoxyribonuclease III [Candidatus Cloacimonadaceae bacterium]
MLTIWSWNVNGMRSALNKGLLDALLTEQPDIVAMQETKLQEEQLPREIISLQVYHNYWSFAEKKGYSGVCLLTKPEPLSVLFGYGVPHFDHEGRIIIAEYNKFFLFNIYFPNGKMSEERLQYKLDFYDKTLEVIEEYRKRGKAVLVTGDFNTAHKPIDLSHPKENEKISGFLPIERAWLDKIVQMGWVDTFREFNPSPHQYSWWSYMGKARERNVGWRLDYFFIDREHLSLVHKAGIRQDIYGSDHCPVYVELAAD